MKKIILLSCVLILGAYFSQAQITLTASNYPLKAWSIITYKYPKMKTNPSEGTGVNWALDSNKGLIQTPIVYSANTISSSFPSNSYYTVGTGNLGFIPYTILTFWRENANGVFTIGDSAPAKTVPLVTYSSLYAGDTIWILNNSHIYKTDSLKLMVFPATYKSSWSSITRHVFDFNLTITSTYNRTASQHVAHIHHHDTIVGYGTMSVRTSTFPYHSIHYPVLMDKVRDYNIDSFYAGGIPMSSTILTYFSLKQGQKSGLNCRYNFYRAYNYQPLCIVNYGGDTTYTNQSSVQYHADSIQPATGINEIGQRNFTSLLYPNPVNNAGNVTVKMFGYDAQTVNCRLYDITGHEVLNTRLSNTGAGMFVVPVAKSIANGMYILQISDLDNNTLLSESLMVQR